jgi:hypothetical protein
MDDISLMVSFSRQARQAVQTALLMDAQAAKMSDRLERGISRDFLNETADALETMGLPLVRALNEAEEECSHMCHRG